MYTLEYSRFMSKHIRRIKTRGCTVAASDAAAGDDCDGDGVGLAAVYCSSCCAMAFGRGVPAQHLPVCACA